MAKTSLDEVSYSGSSSCCSTYDDMNMTENEAMAIWLRRNEEIGERVRRREAAEAQRKAARGSPSSPGGGSSSSDGDESLRSHLCDSVGSGDINSGFQHAAAVTHSDAWNRAISRNVMGEYDPHNTDPAYQDAYHAYQRFVDMNQPGMADNFVASTPGLAALMEQRRHLVARQRHLDLQLHQMDQHMQTSSITTPSAAPVPAPQDQEGDGDFGPSTPSRPLNQSLSAGGIIKTPVGAFSVTKVPTSQRSCCGGSNSDEQVSSAKSVQIEEYKRLSQAYAHVKSENNMGQKSPQQSSYFYGFAYPTSNNSKLVMCSCCQARLYTNPLAVNMFCQSCGRVSRVLEDDLESRWEGKMQEAEDMDMGY